MTAPSQPAGRLPGREPGGWATVMLTRRTALLAGAAATLIGCTAPRSAPEATGGSDDGPPATATLMLLRHGESISAARGVLSTAIPGEGLTGRGLEQARRAARALAGRDLDAVYASPLARALQTAEAFATQSGLSTIALPGAEEIHAGDYEGLPAADYGGGFQAIVDAWASGSLDDRVPGGESGHEFLARLDAALATVLASGAVRPLVVSHGEAIRCWAGIRLGTAGADLQLDSTGFLVVSPGSTGWTLVELRPDGP